MIGVRLVLILGTIGICALAWKYERFFWPGLAFVLLSWVAMIYGIWRYHQPMIEHIKYMVG